MVRASLRLQGLEKSARKSQIPLLERTASVHAVQENRNTGVSVKLPPVMDRSKFRGDITDIPGPKALPLIGNILRFIPYVGEYGNMQMLEQLKMLRKSYGDIVRLDGIANRRPVIFLFNAELSETMYRQEGMWPSRVALESLHYYRQSRENFYNGNFGLTTSQGKMWHDFRSKVNKFMMQPRAVLPHVNQVNQVTEDMMGKIRELRDPITKELPPTFNNELNKWALESIGSIALNTRLGCMKSNLSPDSDPQVMIDSVHTMFEMMFRLELQLSLWKVYHTPALKKLFKAVDTLNLVALKHIDKAKKLYKTCPFATNNKERSVLQNLLEVDELTARIMAMDMLTAGVDTTGNSSGALLYYIATNPEKQEKLRAEAERILPQRDSPISAEALNEIPYTKACIKESLRIFPISIGTLRTMQQDITLNGYKIPKGCDIVAANAIISMDPEEYADPERFIPERWLRGQTEFPSAKAAHPFSYLPFGFGARTCIGRRFAELEMEILLLKMVRNYKLEWHRPPLEYQSRFINTVASPLEFRLIDL